MRTTSRSTRGFTIVEVLVVVGILTLIIGLLLPAMGGAKRRAMKAEEINHIRQVGMAWTMYANNNRDKLLPGYLDIDVQADWNVKFDYPDNSDIPDFVAAPWTWRLGDYLDNSFATLHGYTQSPNASLQQSIQEGEQISETPAFGYNALYVGGWWKMQTLAGVYRAAPRFSDVTVDGRPSAVVRSATSSIRRPSELVTFCSSAKLPEGAHRNVVDDHPGAHWASPPLQGQNEIWGLSPAGGGGGPSYACPITNQRLPVNVRQGPDPSQLYVFGAEPDPVPVGRYTGHVAVLYADGHVASQTVGALADMRCWIDNASHRDYSHSDN